MSWQECCCSTLLPVASSCSASLWDLLRAWGSPKGSLGGRAVPLPIRCEAKSAPGRPFHGTQAASVNTPWLIGCRGCLPSGRPRRAGGWEGLRDAALELQGRQQPSAPAPARVGRRRGPGWERPAKDVQGTAATGPWSLHPSQVVYFAYRLGSLDVLCPRTLVGSGIWTDPPSWPPSSCAPSRLSDIRAGGGWGVERSAVDPELLLRIFGGGEGGVLSLPHIPPPPGYPPPSVG